MLVNKLYLTNVTQEVSYTLTIISATNSMYMPSIPRSVHRQMRNLEASTPRALHLRLFGATAQRGRNRGWLAVSCSYGHLTSYHLFFQWGYIFNGLTS